MSFEKDAYNMDHDIGDRLKVQDSHTRFDGKVGTVEKIIKYEYGLKIEGEFGLHWFSESMVESASLKKGRA